MEPLRPEQLSKLSREALMVLVTLIQISDICSQVKEGKDVVPAARRSKELYDELINLVPEQYGEVLTRSGMNNVLNMGAQFDDEQAERIGGLVSRIPLFVQATIPNIILMGQHTPS